LDCLHPPPRQSLDAFVDTVKRADRYGFARLGTGDTQWHAMECFTTLTLMALNSEKAEIGPRVTNPVTREPSVMASAIASLEIISQGRAVLGIGRGDSAVHNIGLKPSSVEATLDYIVAVRELLEKGETIFQGRHNRFTWPRPPRAGAFHRITAEDAHVAARRSDRRSGADRHRPHSGDRRGVFERAA
jgi:5,10-methylenetetrahydromethanopterin reductase